MGKWLKAGLALLLGLSVAQAYAQGTINAINAQVTYGAVPDWTYVAGSSTGTGTNNATALTNALNGCGQNGASYIYLPPGSYYIASQVTFGNCDTTLIGTANSKIVCNLAITCLQFAPSFGSQEQLAGIIEGYSNTNSNGFAPTTGGSNCEVGDILTLRADANSYARTVRSRTLFQVATCSAGAVATLNVLQAGEYLLNPGSSTGAMQTVSGTTTGVSTTNLTWSTAPQIGGGIRTELVLNGPNSTTEGGNCITLTSDSSSLCMGDKIKVISSQEAPWQYSTGLRNIKVVNSIADPSYGPVVASGGSGCSVNDVLTLVTLTSPVARNARGMPVQIATTTAATLKVTAVTASGAVTAATVTTQGTYDHISYGPIPTTGGTCSTGPSFYLTFTASSGMGFGEIAQIAQVVDATHILLNRLLYFPHVSDATNPPIIAKLPSPRLVLRDVTIQASGQIHNTTYSGRVPAALRILGAVAPRLDNYHCAGHWERCLEEHSVWHGQYDIVVEDAVDMPTQSGFGYGFASFGGGEGSTVKIVGGGMRHAVTSGSYPYNYANAATHFAEIGSPADVLVHDSDVSGTHVSCYDDHEDGINWTYANDVCSSDTADPRDTSGVIPTGIGLRSYSTVVEGFRSNGNVECISDSSQRFPFSGIFATPSITHIFDLTCENGDLQVGSGTTAEGYVLNGDVTDGAYGSHDPYAATLIQNAHFSNFTIAMDATEGANRVNCNLCYFEDVSQIMVESGPTDFSITNSILDNLNSFRVPAIAQLTQRSTGPHYTGTNIAIFDNDLWEQTATKLSGSSNPNTLFRTLETAGTNGTTVYLGSEGAINGPLSNMFLTSGAPITLTGMNYNPQTGNGVQKVTAIGVSLATTGDQATIAIPPQISKYAVLEIDVGNCSANASTGLAGVWTAASKGGTNVAANQALTGCASTTTRQQLALTATAGTTDLTSATLFFNVGTSVTSPTADVTVWLLDKSIH